MRYLDDWKTLVSCKEMFDENCMYVYIVELQNVWMEKGLWIPEKLKDMINTNEYIMYRKDEKN